MRTIVPLDKTSYLYVGTGYANPHAVTQLANGQSTTTYSYDQNGNLSQKTTDGLTTTYLWDYANRLIALGSGGATTTYGYDAFGSRVFQSTATTTTLYPFKWYSVASSTGSGPTYATTTEYVFNGDTLVSTIDQQFASGTATGTSQSLYIHSDHLGSTNVVTNASGTVVQTLDYYPFGAQRISSGSGVSDRQFIGERYDANTDLNYLNARYYQSARGQFLSQDPAFLAIGNPTKIQQITNQDQQQFLMDPQQHNSYSYARNNPIIQKDPSGNFAPIVWFAGAMAVRLGSYALTSYDVLQYLDTKLNPGYYPETDRSDAQAQASFSGFVQAVGEFGSRKQQVALDVLGIGLSGTEYFFGSDRQSGSGPMSKVSGVAIGKPQTNMQQSFLKPTISNGPISTPQSNQNRSNNNTPTNYNSYSGGGGGSSYNSLVSSLQSLVASLTQLVASLSSKK